MSRRRLLIDGHNVIGRVGRYDASDIEGARTRLVEDVASYAAGEDLDAVVVFDAAGNPLSDGVPHRVAGVTVVFSESGEDADTLIERLASEASPSAEETVVVTSDAQTRAVVEKGSVTGMSAERFVRTMTEDSSWRDHALSGGARSRLEDRLEARIRDVLHRWARGG